MTISMNTVNHRRESLLENLNYYKTPYGTKQLDLSDKHNISYILAENYITSVANTKELKSDNGEYLFKYFCECCKDIGANSTTYKLSDYIDSNIIPKLESFNTASNILEDYKEYIPEDIFSSFMESFHVYEACDRLLRNDTKLNKRFNIDKFIYNNRYSSNNDIIYELCEFIDTYDISLRAKYNIALESIMYSFYKNGVSCNSGTILEEVTDYFLDRDMIIRDTDFIGMQKVANQNDFINKDDTSKLTFLKNNDHDYYRDKVDKMITRTKNNHLKDLLTSLKNVSTESDAEQYIKSAYELISIDNTLNDRDIEQIKSSIKLVPLISGVRQYYVDLSVNRMNNTVLQGGDLLEAVEFIDEFIQDTTDQFSSYYQESEKNFTESLLESKDLAESKDVKSVIDAFKADQNKTPNRFVNMTKRLFTKSPESIIDEIPSVLTIVKTCFIFSLVAVPIIGPVLAAVTGIVNKLVTDHISYKETQKLISKLEDEKEKVSKKRDKSTSDSVIAKCDDYIECIDKNIDKLQDYLDTIKDIDDDDYGNDDFESFEELASILINTSVNAINAINTDKEALIESIQDNIHLFTKDYGLLESFSYCVANCPNLVDILKYKEVLDDRRFVTRDYRESSNITSILDRLYLLKERVDPVNESYIEADAATYLREALSERVVTEAIDFNNLKLTLQGFRKKVQNVKTKEQAFWKNVDINSENLMKGLQRAMTSDRREAIVKGSIIPSMSKLCKSLITVAGSAGVGAITGQPWIPVVTAVGMLASSKYLNDRERKLLYEEIDTELQVLERQIEIAQNDQDMNQYRFLLNYKKRLEREKIRIKYGSVVKGKTIPLGGRNSNV